MKENHCKTWLFPYEPTLKQMEQRSKRVKKPLGIIPFEFVSVTFHTPEDTLRWS